MLENGVPLLLIDRIGIYEYEDIMFQCTDYTDRNCLVIWSVDSHWTAHSE